MYNLSSPFRYFIGGLLWHSYIKLLLLYTGAVAERDAGIPLCSQGDTGLLFSSWRAGMSSEQERCRELQAIFGSAYQLPAGLQSLSHRERSMSYTWV